MKALVFGSLNIDNVYTVDHFVKPGETLSSEELKFFCGGKGLNQAIALSRSGVETWQAGAVGKADGQMLIDCLNNAGVNTKLVEKKDIPSGHAIIQNNSSGENSIILFGGSNMSITKENVLKVMEHFEKGDFLILQNEINQMSFIMECAHKIGMKIVLNPSPINEKINELPLEYVSYFILNEIEGAVLSGIENDEEKIAQKLSEKYPDAQIVLTLGKNGSVYRCKDTVIKQPIYKVKAVDTTAAGDTFTGFFFGSIMKNVPIEEAMDIAAKASAIAVGRKGASPSIPSLEEVLNSSLSK